MTEMHSDALTMLADRQAITELIYRYCRAIDRIDIPLGHSIWHEDAIADYGDVYQGPGRGVIDRICEYHRQMIGHSHQVTNITITLDGERAGSEAYALVATRHRKGETVRQVDLWVRYLDRWSKRNGRWGIDKRFTVIDFDEIREVKPLQKTDRGSRDLADPSYAILGRS